MTRKPICNGSARERESPIDFYQRRSGNTPLAQARRRHTAGETRRFPNGPYSGKTNQLPLAVARQTRLVCSICWVTFGSGPKIAGTTHIWALRQAGNLGNKGIAGRVSFGAAHISATGGVFAPRIEEASHTIIEERSSDFVSPSRSEDRGSSGATPAPAPALRMLANLAHPILAAGEFNASRA